MRQRNRRRVGLTGVGAVAVAVVLTGCRWPVPASQESVEQDALSICAVEVKRAGGVVGELHIAWSARSEGAALLWVEGATLKGRPIRCTTDVFPQGGWVGDVSLSYLDGTPV